MKAKIWKVEFGNNWSKERVEARNIEQAMCKARRIHIKETRANGWGKGTEKLPITCVELIASGQI